MANLLSKINIDGVLYDIKDAAARDQIAGLVEAAKGYMKTTGEFADDASVKAYVDAQVGAINKFDVSIVETLPTASAETMFILYLVKENDAASGFYVEYITIENDGAYSWEAIGSTKMDVTGFVTEDALNDALEPYELKANLKALAYKDNATGTVAGETISGVKATGKAAGSIEAALGYDATAINSNGKFTPAGNVTGSAKDVDVITVTVSNADADATLSTADYTPAGEVSVEVSGATFNTVTSAGTVASFEEGAFTPATLDSADVTANYATEGLVGTVADETLTFTAAGIAAITATKVNGFNGGSKAADTFIANTPATIAAHTISATATFAGTKAEDAIVTGVSYKKAAAETAVNITKKDTEITATFVGTEGDLAVAGSYDKANLAKAEFVPGDIELNVGDIVVSEKEVTVQ